MSWWDNRRILRNLNFNFRFDITGFNMLLPRWLSDRESVCQGGDASLIPRSGRYSGEGNGNPLQYYCLEKFHGQSSKAGYSPWGRKDSDMTKHMNSPCNSWFSKIRKHAAATSLQSCPTLWPHRRQPTRLPCPWDSPAMNNGVGCNFPFQCMKVKCESDVAQSCPTLSTSWTAAHQAPPSMGFSRQKYWSGVPLPSPKEAWASIKKIEMRSSMEAKIRRLPLNSNRTMICVQVSRPSSIILTPKTRISSVIHLASKPDPSPPKKKPDLNELICS